MNITSTVAASVVVDETLAAGTNSATVRDVSDNPSYSFANGTTASKVDLVWSKSSTLAASASETWTLSALTDGIGRTVALAKVRVLEMWITAGADGDFLTVGAAATHPWTAPMGGTTPTFTVYDYELKVNKGTAGWPVVAATTDQLKVANSGSGSITYRILLQGSSV